MIASHETSFFPAHRPGPLAVSGASRRKHTPESGESAAGLPRGSALFRPAPQDRYKACAHHAGESAATLRTRCVREMPAAERGLRPE
jgi:hypothetical protein